MGDRNYLIRDIPADVDHIMNTLATLRGMRKWELVREAMVEYAAKHKKDITALAAARTRPLRATETPSE